MICPGSITHDRIGKNLLIQAEYMLLCVKHISRIKKSRTSLDTFQLADAVLNDFGTVLAPIQIKSEIYELLEILKALHPENILEIGSAKGGTLYLFSSVADEKAEIVAIDVPVGIFRRTYSLFRKYFFRAFMGNAQKLHIIEDFSQKKSTLDKVKKIWGDRKLDFLFIDGDHSFEGVKKDFELYSPLVRDGGLICFHDIVRHPPGTVSHAAEVDVFWDSIKSEHDHLEIIESDTQIWGGIGVIKKGGIPSRICKKISLGHTSLLSQQKAGSNNPCSYDSGFELEGFSSPEPESDFSWTDSENAVIRTKISRLREDQGYVMEIGAIPFMTDGANYTDVLVNGKKIRRWIFEKAEKQRLRAFFSVSLMGDDGNIEIRFVFSPRLSPHEAGISSDKRKLGLAVFDIDIKTTGIHAS